MASIVRFLFVLSAMASMGHVLALTESVSARRNESPPRSHSPGIRVEHGDGTTSVTGAALSPLAAIPRGAMVNPIAALSSGHSCYYWVVYAAKCVPGHTDPAVQECLACAAKHAANLTAEVCGLHLRSKHACF